MSQNALVFWVLVALMPVFLIYAALLYLGMERIMSWIF